MRFLHARLFGILRHDPKYRSNKVDGIDNDKRLQNVIWPIADFTKWLAQLLYFTRRAFLNRKQYEQLVAGYAPHETLRQLSPSPES